MLLSRCGKCLVAAFLALVVYALIPDFPPADAQDKAGKAKKGKKVELPFPPTLPDGKDGFLYFSTHRGSTNITSDKVGYLGDWIIRCDPKTGKAEVVAHGPVPKHCIPNSVLDPDRMIFYGGTAAGTDAKDKGVQFFA